MPCWTNQPWQHNLNQTASGKPGAVQSVIVDPNQFDPNLLSLGLADIDPFGLFHMVVKHVVDDPTSELDGWAERARSHLKEVKRMFRVNNLDAMMYRLPEDEETHHLLSNADILMDMFGESKVREFMDRSENFEISPELADPSVIRALGAKLGKKELLDA